MRFASLALLGVIIAGAFAAPSPEKYVLHEKREGRLKAWTRGHRLHRRSMLPMRIGLKQSNLDRGHEMLMDVSHHESPNYGKHWTAKEVADFFAPSQDTVNAVKAWLESSGVAAERIGQSTNKQWLAFEATAEEAERLLKTKYHVYEHGRSGRTQVGCEEYHVPGHVQEHIDYITPGLKLLGASDKPRASRRQKKWEGPAKNAIGKRIDGVTSGDPAMMRSGPPFEKPMPISMDVLIAAANSTNSSALANCDLVITPACVRALYNVTDETTATAGNELGIFEDLGDIYATRDLDLFFEFLYPEIPQGTKPIDAPIDGAIVPIPDEDLAEAGVESALDLQISYPLIWPQNSIVFQTDDIVYESNYTFEGFLNNFFDAIDGSYCTFSDYGETGNSPLDPPYPDPAPGGYKGELQCGVYAPTNVISISYGGNEYDLPVSYQRRQCDEIMKLGMQGISVIVSSGDYGVAGPPGEPGEENGCLIDGTVFNPDFPSTCPYITALGSTFLPEGADVTKDEEISTTRFPSGGGFSNIYEAPDYQTSYVATYFETADPGYPYYSTTNNQSIGANGGIYNRIGRGYPDFAANGDNAFIFADGRPRTVGGTSESAPLFASLLTRINEKRLGAGMSTVGFVNPILV
ncbi:MAG: hypothetical protein Q9227_002871 [Pyrenula ochraceoflavens]